jgi:hypothetical protein
MLVKTKVVDTATTTTTHEKNVDYDPNFECGLLSCNWTL